MAMMSAASSDPTRESGAGQPRRWRDLGLWALLALLAVAFAFQFVYSLREVPQPKPRERLATLIPSSTGSWIARDESLGATETLNETVLKILNLDDFVYRRFAQGARSFTVYAAYWAPGKMPTRLVASHTPDRCWTENGMRCVDMRFRVPLALGSRPLLPAECRSFVAAAGEKPTHVAYWHTVEGRLYDYGARFNAVPSPWLWWKDTLTQAAYGSREQLFVRIASETPLEDLWRDGGFQEVMTRVADLGLWGAAR